MVLQFNIIRRSSVARDRLQYAVYKLQLDNVYYSSYSSKL